MNDEFLSDFRKIPSPDFANGLYLRITKAARDREIHRRTAIKWVSITGAWIILAFALLMIFSPAARTAARNLIGEIIDTITFKNTTVFVNSDSVDVSKLPQRIESYSEVWTLSNPTDISTKHAFLARLPEWVPSGYVLQENAVLGFISPSFDHPPLYAIYQWKDAGGDLIELMVDRGACPPEKSLSDCSGQMGISVGINGEPKKVSVNGEPAIISGSVLYLADLPATIKEWNPKRGFLVPQGQLLYWSDEETRFFLMTNSMEIQREDLIRMAESIP